MKGRKPTPTHLKLVMGNPGKRKINHDEPKTEYKTPEMPSVLADSIAQEHWSYIVAELESMGTLAHSDMGIITAAALAWNRMVRAEERLREMSEKKGGGYIEVIPTKAGNVIMNPIVRVANTARVEFVKYCAELGLSPTSRTRIKVEKPKQETRLERLMG